MAQKQKTAQDYIREVKAKVNKSDTGTSPEPTNTAQQTIAKVKAKLASAESTTPAASATQNNVKAQTWHKPENYPQPTPVTAAGLVQNGVNAVYDAAKKTAVNNTYKQAEDLRSKGGAIANIRADNLIKANDSRLAYIENQKEKALDNLNLKEIEARAAKTALKDYLVNKTGGIKTVDVSKTTGGSLSDKLTAGLTQKTGSNSVFENQAKRVETTPYNSLIDYDKAERAAQNSPEYAALESALFKTRAAANPARGIADDVVGSVSSIGAIPYVVGQAIVDGNVDTYNPAFRGVRRYNSSKEGLTDGKGGVANFAINTGLSMLESAARMPLAALGTNVPVALAGLSAGANAAYDAAERGATPRQALATGTLQGAAEAGAEKISLGSLLENVKTGGSIIKNIAKQAGVEAGEEITTETLNTIIDGIIMGDKSNYSVDVNNAYNDYISQGYTPEDALNKAKSYATSNVAKNLLLSGLGGAISGGVFSGVGNIPNIPYSYNQYKANKAINKAMKEAVDANAETKPSVKSNETVKTKPNIKSGETIETKYEQTFGNSAQHLKNFTSGYSEKSKTNFVTGYNNEMDSADYAAVFNKIYGISKNSSEPKLDRTRLQEYLGTVEPNMSNENLINTATRAWFAGQNDRKIINNVSAVRGTGKVEYEGNVRLEKAQNEALKTISRAIRVDVVVSDKIAENGYYDRNTGKIYISSNAQQPLRAVFNHEVTHAMQDYQSDAYRELKDYMVAAMNKHNATAWETAVNEIYTKYSEDNPDFTLDMAEDEVIAKTAENFIENPESLEQLANTDVSLARKFVNAFRSTLKRFVEAFKGGRQSIDTMTLEQWKAAESKWIDILYNMSEDNSGTVDIATREQLDQLVEISGGDIGSIEEYAKFKYLKNINQLTAAEVEESTKAFENDANAEWTRFVKEDYNEERAAEVNKLYSKKLGGYFPKIEVSTKDIDVFGINNLNNLTEVQDKVCDYLKKSFLSIGEGSKNKLTGEVEEPIIKPIVNVDSGITIEVYKGGIEETFGNKKYYIGLPNWKKRLKLAVIKDLAKMLKYGEICRDNAPNYHKNNSSKTFLYLTHPITIDGKQYTVEMDIKKTPMGNRFYLYKIKTVELSKESKSGNDGYNSTVNDSISEKSENVNSKKYSLKTAEEMRRDNQKLGEEVEYLKRQFKTTSKTIEHTMKDVRKTVSAMLNEKSSTADKDHISERIYNLYKDIKENSNGVNDTTLNSNAFKEAQRIAYDIINSAKTVDEHTELMKSEYKSALDELKNYTFKVSEADMNAQDFKDLKSVLFPYIKLSRTDGTSIDSVWSEIYENVGYLIGSDYANADNVADQLDGIANLVSEYRRIKNNTVNPYESGMADMGFEDAVHYTTMELLEGYFIQPKTYADKSNERLNNLREFYEDKLTKQKERLQASYESRETKRKNNEQRSKYIKNITKVYSNLSQKLISNTDKKHIPEELKGSVSALLQLIDPTPQARNIEKPSAVITKFRKIAGQLNELAELNNWIVDEDLAENINELENIIIDENGQVRQIKSLNNDELEIVHQVVAAVNKAVSNRDKTFRNNKAQTISAAANNLVKELGDKKTEITDGHILYDAQREFLGALNANTVFETMLGDTVANFFSKIKEDFFKIVTPRIKFIQDYWADNLKDWNDSEQHEKVVIQGHSMTKGQAMAIYATSLREAAQRHLKQGGVVIAKDYTRNGILKPTLKESKKITVDDSFVEDIRNILTDKDLRICDCVAELMRICSSWGNEATMTMYDYEKFNEENYFPMQVDTRRKGSKGGSVDFKENPHARLKNVGMTKALIKNANAPLMISDIIDMATQHAITMAYYSGLTPSLTDFERLYNAYAVEQVDKDIYRSKAVKDAIIGSKGANMQRYIMQWLDDINGGATKFDRSGFDNFFSRSKSAMVGMNIKVILLQPTSIYRALSETDFKYIGNKGSLIVPKNKEVYNDMIKHSGRAMWKDMGFSQVDINKGIAKTVSGRNATVFDKAQDLQVALPNLGDMTAWTALWYGARNKIADTHPNIEIDSEQYYELVNDEFGRIIDRTQVMDSPFSKSQHLRNNHPTTKLLTMFTTEPSIMFNMIVRNSGDKKEFKKAVGGILASVAVAGIVTGIINTLRAPSEDKDTSEEMLNTFLVKVRNSVINDITGIAGVTPATSAIADIAEYTYNKLSKEYYTPEIGGSYFTPFAELIAAACDVFNVDSKKSLQNRLGKLGLQISDMFGIGLANLYRDIPRAATRTSVAAARQQGYDTYGFDYSIAKWYYNMKSDSGLKELARIAAKADLANSEYADDIKQNIIDETGIKKDILSRKIKSAQTTIINNAADDFYKKYGDELLENASTYRKNGQLYVRAVSYSFGKEGEEAKRYRKQIAKTYNVTEDEIDEALKKIIQKALREDDMYD